MESDLLGRLRNTRLPTAHALLPLFEAVINSVHAIEGRGGSGTITVEIERTSQLYIGDLHGNYLPDIIGFSITDDGIGFNNANYRSFETLDSQAKLAIGGKGVGRLLWLIAFEEVSVESRFEENGNHHHRTFEFKRTKAGIENPHLGVLDTRNVDPGTRVQLRGFRKPFREAAPKSANAIGRRIVEHCLLLYTLKAMPKVIVLDPTIDENLDLDEMYAEEFQRVSKVRTFDVGGYDFTIVDILLRPTTDADNAIHFCANTRAVITKKLVGAVPHSDRPFRMPDGKDVMYWACVTGDLLDNTVDAQRTGFDIVHDGEMSFDGAHVTWEQILESAMAAAAEFLAPHTADAKKASLSRIRNFIEQSEPRYRLLLEHRREQLEALPTTLTDEKLELELHKMLSAWRVEATEEVRAKLKSVESNVLSFAQHKDAVIRALGKLQEVAQSDLVDYVIHRSSVLTFFERLIGLMESGKFAREDALHGLFFPQRTTSDHIDYDQHNLWVLDERLAFHHYLASDLPFSAQNGSPVAVDTERRPDLVLYNRKMAFAGEDYRPFSSVVIVEFKRPERNDYDPDENPVSQVYDYIRDIRSGTARNPDGSHVDRVPDSVPFFCHVVASLTPKLRRQLENMSYTEGPDGQSYYTFNTPLKAYVEVASYAKVLVDAQKRNKAFFDRLGISTSVRRL
jgi:hypothetical protein